MQKDINNFLKGQRLSKGFAKQMEARGYNPANLHELRMNGITVPNTVSLTGTEYRALNLTDSATNNFVAVAAPKVGVFGWMDDVRDERFTAIGYLAGQESVQKLDEGAAFDNTNAGAADEWAVVKSDDVERYAKRFQVSGHLLAHTEGLAEALLAEARGAINEAIDVDAKAALAAAATATGNAFDAAEVIEQFAFYNGNFNVAAPAAQALQIRKEMKEAGMDELVNRVKIGPAAAYGWQDGKAALYMPHFNIMRDEFSMAAEGEVIIDGQALAQLVAVDVVKFAAS